MHYAKILLLFFSLSAIANETLWQRSFISWGQGYSTNAASQDASSKAQPVLNDLKIECATENAKLSWNTQYGFCSQNNDPMFCKYGCYICPLYGSTTCYIDTIYLIKPGITVEVTIDSDLQTGTTIVGHLKKGDTAVVVQIQGGWVSLKKPDGTAIKGWIKIENLKPSQG